ncbi:MAG: hypothetical protein HOY78_22525 [Saccharothrix sp.]|nr:hypothetical protein [Saccharothrix sp.]
MVLTAALIAGLVAVPGSATAAQDPSTTVLRPTKWLSTDARIRIARDFQGSVSHGRSVWPDPGLEVAFDSPPDTPEYLVVDGRSCAEPIITTSPRPWVSAALSDPDGTGGYFPEDMVRDGGQYAFAARADDGHLTSEWSEPCVITADFTSPANAPGVTSAVYRENAGPPGDGGDGVPGDFTFSADGDQDVVAFQYHGTGIGEARVEADRPGGSATVTVTPTSDGPNSIEVAGVDRAGHRSPVRSYRFWVRTTAPRVKMPIFEVGVPRDVVFTATQEGATAFWYTLDDGEAQQVSVGADGTARATFLFYAAPSDYHVLKVWTVNGTGFRSGVNDRPFNVVQHEPIVSVDRNDVVVGEKVVVTAEPLYPREGVHSYVFQVDDGPEVIVPVAADGSARYEHTTTAAGWHRVRAASVNWSYVRSWWDYDDFTVIAPGPTVSSADYPSGGESGGPGVTGTFTFAPSPRLPVEEYRYEFDDGQQGKVLAGPDGTVSVRWTPRTSGHHWVRVVGVTPTGAETEGVSYSFAVKSLSPTGTGSRIVPASR